MKQTIKTIITVLVVLGCGFICMISLGSYFAETNYMEYDIERMIDPVITQAAAECIGNSYEGQPKEGYSYYQLTLTLENQSNFGLEESYIYLSYEGSGDEGYYYIREVENEDSFAIWEAKDYFPAGKTAEFNQVLCIEDGCRDLDVIYRNYSTKSEQKVHIEL